MPSCLSHRGSLLGNVGNLVVFRVGAKDATVLSREFAPKFSAEDLVSIPHYKAYVRVMIDGAPGKAFSARMMESPVQTGLRPNSALPRREHNDIPLLFSVAEQADQRSYSSPGADQKGKPREPVPLDGHEALYESPYRTD